MPRKCKDCPSFAEFGNTAECGLGVCMVEYAEAAYEGECIYNPKPHTCADCQHFIEYDMACLNAKATDSAVDCCGFIDIKYTTFVGILKDWLLRGEDCENNFAEAMEEAKAFVTRIGKPL